MPWTLCRLFASASPSFEGDVVEVSEPKHKPTNGGRNKQTHVNNAATPTRPPPVPDASFVVSLQKLARSE